MFSLYLQCRLMVASVARLPKRQHIARFNSFANLLRGLNCPYFIFVYWLVFMFPFCTNPIDTTLL